MKVPNSVKKVAEIFASKGFDLFVVGGAVRDFKMGIEIPKDFDLVTNAHPEVVQELIKTNGGTCDLVGNNFGVVIANIFNDTFEIASFRNDEKGVERSAICFKPTTIVEDSERRDFKFNSLFFNVFTNEIIDLQGGCESIKNKVVETVGSAKDRFNEDPSRLLRAIRFKEQLQFDLSDDIVNVLKDAEFVKSLFKRLPHEQIVKILTKTVTVTVDIVSLTKTLNDFNLFQFIFPNTEIDVENVKTHTNDMGEWIAMLVNDVANKTLSNLCFENSVIDAAMALQACKNLNDTNFIKVCKNFQIFVKSFDAFAKNENLDFLNKLSKHVFDKEAVQTIIKNGAKKAEINKLHTLFEFNKFNK